jgi:hypothetical protein
MRVTGRRLRQNLYKILDQALGNQSASRSGSERTCSQDRSSAAAKLAKLKERTTLVGVPESIVPLNWLKERSELK